MQNIIKNILKSKKQKIIIVIAIIIFCFLATIGIKFKIDQTIAYRKQLEEKPLLEYEIKKKINDNNMYHILIKINSIDGIETVKYQSQRNGEEIELNCKGKQTIAIDWDAEDNKDYNFKIKVAGKEEENKTLHFEIPRIKGNYTLVKGVYTNEPDLTGYNKNYTRYLNVNSTDNNMELEPKNWITSDEKPENWYDYKNSQWANIYVEHEGLEAYYVWIPRYCFKLDQANQKSDVKFIDVYNNYKDPEDPSKDKTWEELKEEGYQVPEAFEFNYVWLPGYWAMKYTSGERNEFTIDFETVANNKKIQIKGISKNTTEEVKKYVYAIDGKVISENETGEDYTYNKTEEEQSEKDKEYIVNVTALGENGKIIGSMTKTAKTIKVNEPELEQFNQETTFYVTYDENGEHSTIPISKEKPDDWYDYSESRWANIVTRNNGQEVYYVWIPRYEFKLNQTSQRSSINFIEGTNKQATQNYQIPEAFTFNGQELTGYWAMKYTAGDEHAPRFDTEVVATSNSIRTKGITGTEIGENKQYKYKYYINGDYKGEKNSSGDNFEYTELSSGTKYTILVEIRDNEDKYIGSIVKQISTIEPNKPDLTGFKEEYTHYVTYDEEGNETIGNTIKNDGSNAPEGWYDYSKSKWANIVVEANNKKVYYVWIPRYEFMITSAQQKQPAIGRTEVRFIKDTSTDTDLGYQIPEAFKFNEKELTGYWAMKYTAGD